MALFRMARQVAEGTGLINAFPNAFTVERGALGAALEWSVARGQTPARLKAALAAFRAAPLPPVTDIIRAEANVAENTLNLSPERFKDWLQENLVGMARSEARLLSALIDVLRTPWELMRARRANRFLSSKMIQFAKLEPWQRAKHIDPEVEYVESSTRSIMMLLPYTRGYVVAFDNNEVARCALVQLFAIRTWQLNHNGEFPKTLDVLVPGELPDLPTDPYSGQRFVYFPASGQPVPLLHDAVSPPSMKVSRVALPGSWLLVSVGPNGQDDVANSSSKPFQNMDYVFEIPPVEKKTSTEKKP